MEVKVYVNDPIVAKDKNGVWRAWSELCEGDKRAWEKAMNDADKYWQDVKDGRASRPTTVMDHLLNYERKHKLV